MSHSSVRSYGNVGVEGEYECPLYENRNCWCGRQAEVRISESQRNPGKFYLKSGDKKCDFLGMVLTIGKR